MRAHGVVSADSHMMEPAELQIVSAENDAGWYYLYRMNLA